MSFTLNVDHEHQLIEVIHVGETPVLSRIESMERGAHLLQAHGFRRVLVDLRQSISAPDTIDVKDAMTRRVANAPLVAGSRLAYLHRAHQHANLLAENMAAARHDALRHFTAREAALAWLLADGRA
jgi:hypothetical protein